MIRTLTTLVLLGALLAGCSRKSADTETPTGTPTPLANATPALSTPGPAPATPMPATPAPRRLAAEGTYFLLVKKSVETSDGILGFKPGTQVKRNADGSFSVEGHKLQLLPAEVTNDLDIAASHASADAQRQAALRQTPAPMTPAATPSPTSGTPMLQPGVAAGSAQTVTKDGWVWGKDARGAWRRVRPVR